MFIFHEGLPGSGKSFEAVVNQIIPALKKGRPVYAYINGLNHKKLAELTDKTEEEIKEKEIKNYFGLGDWVCGTNSVRMQLYYPIEGITLSLMFKKINNKWTITSNALWEE